MKVKGQLERAQAEDRSTDFAGTVANGMFWFNNVDKDLKFADGVIVQKINTRDKAVAFTLVNNVSATDVTGLVFDSANFHVAKIEFAIRRRDDGQEATQTGTIAVVFEKDAGTWDIATEFVGPSAGVTFTITPSGGQIQYATTDFAGSGEAGFFRYDVVKRYAAFAS